MKLRFGRFLNSTTSLVCLETPFCHAIASQLVGKTRPSNAMWRSCQYETPGTNGVRPTFPERQTSVFVGGTFVMSGSSRFSQSISAEAGEIGRRLEALEKRLNIAGRAHRQMLVTRPKPRRHHRIGAVWLGRPFSPEGKYTGR